jgi:hypothetical protein
MTHLSPDERLTLIELADEPDHPHLGECAPCRAEIATARALLSDARLAQVPEPSPLFWDHFSRRVSDSIAAEPAPVRPRRSLWRVLIPLSVGVAALLLTVVIDRTSVPRRVPGSRVAPVGESGNATAGVVSEDAEWVVLSDLAGEFDLETLSDSLGTSGASGAESAVWQLNEQERAELARLLRAELRQGPSGS